MEQENDTEVADDDLKEIAEVLDFSPVLTEEQLWLAKRLRKSVFSYKISILKLCFGVFELSYDKILYPLEGLSQKDRDRCLVRRNYLAFHLSTLEKQAEMMHLTEALEARVSGCRPEES